MYIIQRFCRYLKSICSETRYFEIDESSAYNSPKESIRFQADFSPSTDTRSTVDSDPSRERPSSNTEDNVRHSFHYNKCQFCLRKLFSVH